MRKRSMILLNAVILLWFHPDGLLTANRYKTGLNNEYLRNHFRKEAIGDVFAPGAWVRHNQRLSPAQIEARADRLIARFLGQVEEGLGFLAAELAVLKRALLELERQGEAVETKAQLKESLKQIKQQSNRLHRTISFPLRYMESKVKDNPPITKHSEANPFREEIEYMEHHFLEASDRINTFFFTSGLAIQIEQLSDENMLKHLYRVGQMAEALSDEIE